MKIYSVTLAVAMATAIYGCTENYSNGERIGLVTQFSLTGAFWKSYEGHLNMTQTGMNSSQPFDFSVDNDKPDTALVALIDSAARLGWKVKLTYHETLGKNWFQNRGGTNHFVIRCDVLSRNPIADAFGGNQRGAVVDTIYVVVVPKPQ